MTTPPVEPTSDPDAGREGTTQTPERPVASETPAKAPRRRPHAVPLADRVGMDDLTARLTRGARTLVTLAALAVIFLLGVTWGWKHLTAPVPSLTAATPDGCTDRAITRGDRVEPDTVTVSVLNAGDRDGLADRTMSSLTGDGFVEGKAGNAPTAAQVRTVQIWTTDPTNPAVKLVKSYLGNNVDVERSDAQVPGVAVLVGSDFKGVRDGLESVRARHDAVVCGP